MPNQQVTDAHLANMMEVVTRPIYLLQLNHSGTVEYLSCSGECTFDSQVYTPGGASIGNVVNAKEATVVVPNSPARVDELQTNAWRDGICKLYYIPALPADGNAFVVADAILMLDGIIDSSGLRGETLNIVAKNKWLTGNMSPVYTFDQVCNHIPPAGSTLEWDNTTVVLDSVNNYDDRQLVVGSTGGNEQQFQDWYSYFQYPSSA